MKSLSFSCTACDKKYSKWSGHCYSCGSYDSIFEEIQKIKNQNNININPLLLSSINTNIDLIKTTSEISELDRVLGGGIMQNSVILLAGMPGIGKSTLLLSIAKNTSKKKKILYITTEESINQIKIRADRLEIICNNNFYIIQETSFENICAAIENIKPEIVLLDSLQNMIFESSFLTNHIGKIKEATHSIVDHCKKNEYTLIITGHVTKDGSVAGPKMLEHLVDVVLYFEGEENSNIRILRSTKNRFGSVDEAGFFLMTASGIKECEDPQNTLIEQIKPKIGSAITWYNEGSRSFLIEIQTLINNCRNGNPQRVINGIDHKQLILVCAVLEKYLKIPLYEYDIFCKVSGNIKVKNTQTDLALASALISSYMHKMNDKIFFFDGELSLSGDITSKTDIPKNILFEKYGIGMIISPIADQSKIKSNIETKKISSIYQLPKIFN
jgi:DNA repair protein RadA/Sms